MTTTFRLAAIALFAGLAGCQSSAPPPPAATSMPSETMAMRTGSPADERACLDAIDSQTDGEVLVLSSEFSQANTLVMVGVGPERAPWRCLVSGGIVGETMFAGSEGAL